MGRWWCRMGWCNSDLILRCERSGPRRMAASSAPAAILRDAPSALLRMRSSEHRWPVQSKMSQQLDERFQPLAPVGFDIESFVVQKAGAIAQASAILPHIALDDLRCRIALAAERAGQIAARLIKNVGAAPVDELAHAQH